MFVKETFILSYNDFATEGAILFLLSTYLLNRYVVRFKDRGGGGGGGGG